MSKTPLAPQSIVNGRLVLPGLHLRTCEVQRGEHAVTAAMQCRDLALGVGEIATRQIGDHALVGHAGVHALGVLVALPPAPAAHQRECHHDACEDAEAVFAQPGTDAFTLFVFVRKIVDRHAVSRRTRDVRPVVLLWGPHVQRADGIRPGACGSLRDRR